MSELVMVDLAKLGLDLVLSFNLEIGNLALVVDQIEISFDFLLLLLISILDPANVLGNLVRNEEVIIDMYFGWTVLVNEFLRELKEFEHVHVKWHLVEERKEVRCNNDHFLLGQQHVGDEVVQ